MMETNVGCSHQCPWNSASSIKPSCSESVAKSFPLAMVVLEVEQERQTGMERRRWYVQKQPHTHTKIQCPRLKVHEMHKNACREHKTDIVCPQSIWVELPPDIPTGKVARLSTRVLQSLAMSPANVLHQQILPGNIVQATCWKSDKSYQRWSKYCGVTAWTYSKRSVNMLKPLLNLSSVAVRFWAESNKYLYACKSPVSHSVSCEVPRPGQLVVVAKVIHAPWPLAFEDPFVLFWSILYLWGFRSTKTQ